LNGRFLDNCCDAAEGNVVWEVDDKAAGPRDEDAADSEDNEQTVLGRVIG
jgi:hypothetical protein